MRRQTCLLSVTAGLIVIWWFSILNCLNMSTLYRHVYMSLHFFWPEATGGDRQGCVREDKGGDRLRPLTLTSLFNSLANTLWNDNIHVFDKVRQTATSGYVLSIWRNKFKVRKCVRMIWPLFFNSVFWSWESFVIRTVCLFVCVCACVRIQGWRQVCMSAS